MMHYPNAKTFHPSVTNPTPLTHFSPSPSHFKNPPTIETTHSQSQSQSQSHSHSHKMDNFTDLFSPYTTPTSPSFHFSNLLQQQPVDLPPLPESLQFPENYYIDEQPLMFPTTPSTLIPDHITEFQFSAFYQTPYEQPNLQFPYMDTINTISGVMNQPYNNEYHLNPLLPFPMEHQTSVPFTMQGYQYQSQSLEIEQPVLEKDEKRFEATIARERRRKQNKKKNKSGSAASASVTPSKKTVIVTQNTEKRIRNVFYAPDGKRLLEICTKILKKSDVGKHGRIVLPKREVETELPRLWENKVATTIDLKDVCSELQWTLRYRYWINNNTRMYVLESAGDFLRHYGLKIGDSITLYADESSRLEKENQMETKDIHPIYEENTEALAKDNKDEGDKGESSSQKDVSPGEKEEGSGGSSSEGGEDVKIKQPENAEGALNWVVGEEAKENAECSMDTDIDLVYRELENILEVGGGF